VALAAAIALAMPLQARADGPDHGGGSSAALCAAIGQASGQTLAALQATPALAGLVSNCSGDNQTTPALCASLPSSLAAACAGTTSTDNPAATQGTQGGPGFDDLGGYGWASAAIGQLASLQILRGVGHGQFDPGGTLTRAQFAALIVRLFNLAAPATGATAYVDVPSSYWAASDIAAAAPYMSQFKTPGGPAFEPDLPATRIEVGATIGQLEVAEGAAQLPSTAAAASAFAAFSDGAAVPAGLAPAAAVAVDLSFMKGYPDGTFGVSDAIDRAEAAVLLERVLATGETMGAGGTLTAAKAPTVTAIAPSTGAAGTPVTITGTGFTSGATVTFGGMAAAPVQVLSATEITATAPNGTGTVDVTVTTAAGTSAAGAADQFTFTCVQAQTVTGAVYCVGS